MTPGPQIATFNKFSLFISGKHVPLITTDDPTPEVKLNLNSLLLPHSFAFFPVGYSRFIR